MATGVSAFLNMSFNVGETDRLSVSQSLLYILRIVWLAQCDINEIVRTAGKGLLN